MSVLSPEKKFLPLQTENGYQWVEIQPEDPQYQYAIPESDFMDKFAAYC